MELKTVGLTKKFGSKTAVDNLNITLTNGVYGLLGANGAGKTTLMRLLCNIQNPTSGRILLNEKNIVGLGENYCFPGEIIKVLGMIIYHDISSDKAFISTENELSP